MVGFGGFGVVGRGTGLAGVGGIDAAVVGHIAAQIRRHGVRHDQHRHPHRLRHALDGRQTWITLDRPALGKNLGCEDGVFHGASRLRLRRAYERAVLNGSQVESTEPAVRLGTRVQW